MNVSFATPSVEHRVRSWRVAAMETMSDYRYGSTFPSLATAPTYATTREDAGPNHPAGRCPDKDTLMEASVVMAWHDRPAGPINVEEEVAWFRDAMMQICNASLPRIRGPPSRPRQVYWWTGEIAELRCEYTAARRRYARHRRRRNGDATTEARLYEAYRERKKDQQAIKVAKNYTWEKLLGTKNLWGRPYLIIRNKLRTWAPPVT